MDNRETILETALDLFYTRGYDAVGVQEIAERSGVTKPTLYYYFKSKYGLLEQLLKSRSEGFAAELKEGVRLPRRLEEHPVRGGPDGGVLRGAGTGVFGAFRGALSLGQGK